MPMSKQHSHTREQWLSSAVSSLRPLFDNHTSLTLPDTIHVSVGFPSTRALSNSRRRIGECWSCDASKDGNPHVFVSPLIADGSIVLEVLTHELVHAAGIHGHRSDFRKVAIAVGLEGKMTATVAGDELKARLNVILGKLGPYPHSVLSANGRPTKKQSTRLLKCECSKCSMIIRVTSKYINDPGLPVCRCGGMFGVA